ncbi:MAG: FG-GAP repeat protein [Myxococcales bacterium]|nr:FG-GAP repeat protein [Myxococcales bacterium]
MRIGATLPLALALVAGCTVPTDVRLDSGAGDGSTDITDATDSGRPDDVSSDRDLDASESGDGEVGDTGIGDTGVGDTGIGDTGIGDTGIGDTGIGDTGVSPSCGACPVENVCSGSDCDPVGTPVAIAPAAHAIVVAQFPRILFSAGASSDRTRVDFCRDPACAMVDQSATVMHAAGATNQSFVPTTNVFSDGRRRFWRVVAGNARGFARRGTTPRAIHRAGPGSARASLQGWVVGYAQDFNNDGNSELAASSGGSIDRIRTQPGGWYVFAGQSSGGATLVSPSPTTSIGLSVTPLHPPPGAPFALRSYGDVNGDGFTDCSWSAHTGLESGTTIGVRGGVELFQGGPAPLATTVGVMYGAGDHDYHVEASAIGDVNGDGFNDALIGAAGDSQPSLRVRGRSVLYLGSASGLARSGLTLTDTGAWSWRPFHTGDLDNDGLSEAGLGFGLLAPRSLRVFRGARTSPLSVEAQRIAAVDDSNDDQFGHAMVVGDLDDDGLLELVAAGRRNTRIYVFSQTAPQSLTFGTTPRYTLLRPSIAGGTWASSMDALGDVNNDGLADFIVSASGAGAGAAVVYLGQRSAMPQAVAIDVPMADRRTALAYDNSVAGLTDFNGDGTYEFAVGVPNAGATANNTGYVYIFGWDSATSAFVVRQRVEISTYVMGGAADIFFGAGMR